MREALQALSIRPCHLTPLILSTSSHSRNRYARSFSLQSCCRDERWRVMPAHPSFLRLVPVTRAVSLPARARADTDRLPARTHPPSAPARNPNPFTQSAIILSRSTTMVRRSNWPRSFLHQPRGIEGIPRLPELEDNETADERLIERPCSEHAKIVDVARFVALIAGVDVFGEDFGKGRHVRSDGLNGRNLK